MELFLMRHAEAGRPDPHRYPDDHQRPLSEQGERDQRRVARALVPLLQPLDSLLSSPLRRARQTADIVAEALHYSGRVEETAVLGSACTVERFIAWLENYPHEARILCIGHEPAMSQLAAVFLDGNGSSTIAFAPGALVGLVFPASPAARQGTLRLFLRPAELLTMLRGLEQP